MSNFKVGDKIEVYEMTNGKTAYLKGSIWHVFGFGYPVLNLCKPIGRLIIKSVK